jgi:hypothetical protein
MSFQVQGLLMIGFGTICIAFSNVFGRRTSEFQRQVLGVELTPRALQLGYLFGGLAFCLVGGLALLGVVEFRQ